MNSQLMLLPGFRKEPEASEPRSQIDQFNFRDRVNLSFHDPLPKPRLSRLHSVLDMPLRFLQSTIDMRDCNILPLDPPFGKQPVVVCPCIHFDGEQKQPRRFTVEPVYRLKIWQPCDRLKPDEQRALNILSGRRHWYAMGFVHNQDLVVAVNNQRFLK